MSPRPRFTIVLPAADPAGESVPSVLAQTFGDWELFSPGTAGDRGAGDARVKRLDLPATAGAADAVNRALEIAAGDYLVVLAPGDRLEPHALARLWSSVGAEPADLVYADEVITAAGPTARPAQKPAWSPERLRHQDYIGRACAVRTSLARDVGGYRAAAGSAAHYDLLLRAGERARRVVHLPEPVYRCAPDEPPAVGTQCAAVQDQLDRLAIPARAVPGAVPGITSLERRLEPDRLVSIVIPTRGQSGEVNGEHRTYVVEAVRSALRRTRHRNVEVVVVHDESTPHEVLTALRDVAGDQLVELPYSAPFNFSEKCNLGFLRSRGEFVVLLNDDTEVVSDGWLEALVAPLQEPDVGMTGAKLLYADGTLQHAGHLYTSGSRPAHPLHAYRWMPDGTGPFADFVIDRECSGVTAACAALRRDVYEQVGGLSELVPVNFNDVDLSLKVRHCGFRILWIAGSVLHHFESKSRVQSRAKPAETAFLERRWPGSFRRDDYAPWLAYEESLRRPVPA